MLLKCIYVINGGVHISIRTQARAKRDLIEGVIQLDDKAMLRVATSALPIDGQANAAIEKLIARAFLI